MPRTGRAPWLMATGRPILFATVMDGSKPRQSYTRPQTLSGLTERSFK